MASNVLKPGIIKQHKLFYQLFDVLSCRCCLLLLRDVSAWCLMEHDPAVQLHGAKLLEEVGAMILQYTGNNCSIDQESIDTAQAQQTPHMDANEVSVCMVCEVGIL